MKEKCVLCKVNPVWDVDGARELKICCDCTKKILGELLSKP